MEKITKKIIIEYNDQKIKTLKKLSANNEEKWQKFLASKQLSLKIADKIDEKFHEQINCLLIIAAGLSIASVAINKTGYEFVVPTVAGCFLWGMDDSWTSKLVGSKSKKYVMKKDEYESTKNYLDYQIKIYTKMNLFLQIGENYLLEDESFIKALSDGYSLKELLNENFIVNDLYAKETIKEMLLIEDKALQNYYRSKIEMIEQATGQQLETKLQQVLPNMDINVDEMIKFNEKIIASLKLSITAGDTNWQTYLSGYESKQQLAEYLLNPYVEFNYKSLASFCGFINLYNQSFNTKPFSQYIIDFLWPIGLLGVLGVSLKKLIEKIFSDKNESYLSHKKTYEQNRKKYEHMLKVYEQINNYLKNGLAAFINHEHYLDEDWVSFKELFNLNEKFITSEENMQEILVNIIAEIAKLEYSISHDISDEITRLINDVANHKKYQSIVTSLKQQIPCLDDYLTDLNYDNKVKMISV